MQCHPKCTFVKLKATFGKCYQKVQIDEQVYMALRVIKQAMNKKMEVYYEHILKLANCLNHKMNNSLLTTFFQIKLVPYLWITIIGMKWNTLFLHKEVRVTCKKNIGDANEY